MPKRRIAAMAACAALAAFAMSLAQAQTAKPDPSEIELGPIAAYPAEDVAAQACAPDGVVWTDRKTGYYYPKFAKEYGATPRGTFTCLKGAVAADYWGWGVISNIGGHKGREFPNRFPCTECM